MSVLPVCLALSFIICFLTLNPPQHSYSPLHLDNVLGFLDFFCLILGFWVLGSWVCVFVYVAAFNTFLSLFVIICIYFAFFCLWCFNFFSHLPPDVTRPWPAQRGVVLRTAETNSSWAFWRSVTTCLEVSQVFTAYDCFNCCLLSMFLLWT